MFLGFFPTAAGAAWLAAPTNVTLDGGIYTNDTTPTATWTRPSGATWYQILVDNGNWIDISNTDSYTIWSLANGWHTFYVRARDNSNTVSVSDSVTFEIDTAGPTVPAVSPSTATEDRATTFSVTPSGESTISFCDLYVSGSSVGSMTKNGSTFTKSYTFTNDGSYTVYARCADGDGNYTTGTSRTVTVSNVDVSDTFSVPSVSPSIAVEDQSTTFTVTPYGTLDAIACNLYVSGAYAGSMSKSSATFSKSYTFSNDGSYTVYASCENENGSWVNGTSRTVSVSNIDVNDTFYVPSVSPSSANEDESTTFTVSPYGTLDAIACNLYVSGSSVGSMSKSGSTFSRNYTFSNDGNYTVYAYCENENGTWTYGTSRTVTVSNTNTNDTFTVPSVSPSTATEDQSTTFSVTPYGTLDADECKLYVSGSSVGSMSQSGDTFSKNYTFSNDGSYTVYAYCQDENGDWEYGTSRTVTVYQQSSSNTSLDVPTVSPSTAVEDERTEFTVYPTSNYNVTDCWLYVNGSRVATMDEESTNRFAADYTFSNDGSYSVYARCTDSHGTTVNGDERSVYVSNQSYSYDDADRGTLIKIPCGVYSNTSETCKAVYYYGNDGMRHVFPNESVFYTWYNNFDDVSEVSQDFMSSLTIGKNVTYRPGSVVVKFDSSSYVYAIEAPHTLRHYLTSSLLESDYGSSWVDSLAHVPDSLYSNYSVGSVIDSTSDYNRSTAYYSVDSIDDVL